MDEPIIARDATSLAAALRCGDVTAAQVADAFLTRIDERDADVLAWAYLDREQVRAQAAALDRTSQRGPLHGVPVAIKDVIATADMPTQYGSRLYEGHVTPTDAACVRLLRQAGALILGKTHTVELASIGAPPPTRNPHALHHTPGGSSSGSAAAVADFQAPLALGTQTGGSIIRPASFCGAWALKPSWGSVSTEGVKPFAPSLDTVGWFGRSARDLRLLLDVLSPGLESNQPFSLKSARFAVWETAGWPRAEASTRIAIAAAVQRLRDAGATVKPFDFGFPELAEDQLVIMHAEGRRSFLAEYRADPEQLHPRIAEMARTGGGASIDRLRMAYDRAAVARQAFDCAAAAFDAILAPSTIGEAPQGLAATGDLLFNGLMTLLHIPTVNLPLFTGETGLPVGLTLTGPRFAERQVLKVAEEIARNA